MGRNIKEIAVFGASGMLGQALCRVASGRGVKVTGVDLHGADVTLDITKDEDLAKFFAANRFDCVINCCAIVNHAFCDQNPDVAYKLNARPSAILANLSAECGFKYVYISTDGYFSGDADGKHVEDAPMVLLNEYARTKYAGEVFTTRNPTALVARTNIVGFRGNPAQPTFVEWALAMLKKQEPMTLFTDYYTSSISVMQFAEALFDLLPSDPCGTLNLASSEVSSKAAFIAELANAFDYSLGNAKVGSVTSLVQSKRADSLGLDVSKAEALLGRKLPGLKEVIAQLKREYHD